jgi:hypothetical protein
MRKTAVWHGLWLAFLPGFCFPGCVTFNSSTVPPNGIPDPLLEEILRQETLVKKPDSATLKPAILLREVPIRTPLAQAKSVMERHGFSCWSGVADSKGTCLHCTAYKPKKRGLADKIVVKLFYETQRIVNVEITVEYDVLQSDRGFWPFSNHNSNAQSN